MALILNDNCGMVESAPSADPNTGNVVQISTYIRGQRITIPATATKITEVGWWCDNATEEANFEVGLYTDFDNIPVSAIYRNQTNAKGTTAGWKTATVDWNVVSYQSATMWALMQCDETATVSNIDRQSLEGELYYYESEVSTLPETIAPGGGTFGNILALYVLWEAGGGGGSIVPTIFSISDFILSESKSNIIITGTNFGETQGSGTLQVNSQSNGSGVLSYQTINSWNSGSIDFNPVKGSILTGNNYLLATTSSGLSSNGFPIFFTGSESQPIKIGVLGGNGNKSGASDNNAGAYVSSEKTLNTMQGTNGEALYTVNDCMYNGSSGVIFKSASFASGLVGNYVNIISGGTGTLQNKRYYIQNSHPDWLLIGEGYTNNNNLNITVGGALKTYEEAFSSGVLANGDTLYRSYGNESYTMENGNEITLDGASEGTGRPEIGGGLINYV
jgi:hypothetical protein